MGNLCERLVTRHAKAGPHANPIKTALQETIDEITVNVVPGLSPDLALVATDLPNAPSQALVLRQLVDETMISHMTTMFLDEMALYRPQMPLFKKVEKGGVAGEMYCMNLPLPDSSDLQNLVLQDYRLPFSAEQFIYAQLNQLVRVTESLEVDEVLQWEATENTVLILNRFRTERMLVVAPRNMVALRVIRKIDNDRFLDLVQTVDVTGLASHPTIQELLAANSENFATSFIIGTFIENREGRLHCTSFSRTNFRTSVKVGFMKVFMNRNFENTLNNFVRNCQTVLDRQNWPPQLASPIWFQTPGGAPVPLRFLEEKEEGKSGAAQP